MTRAKTKSIADIFFDFVRDNPRAAAALAFQLGIWAGHSTGSLAKLKNMTKKSCQVSSHDTAGRDAGRTKIVAGSFAVPPAKPTGETAQT